MKNAYIVYRKISFAIVIGFIILGGVSTLVFMYVLKSIPMQLISILIIILPLLLIKQLLAVNTRKLLFDYEKETIGIVIKNKDEIEKSFTFNLIDVNAYRIQFPNRRFTDLMIKLKPGKEFSYSFYLQKNEKEHIDTDALITSFHDFIKSHNQSAEDKIRLLPSFYASTGGMVSIILLVLMFIAVIIVHIIVGKMGVLPITLLLVLGLIIQVILRRRNDLKYFNKMK